MVLGWQILDGTEGASGGAAATARTLGTTGCPLACPPPVLAASARVRGPAPTSCALWSWEALSAGPHGAAGLDVCLAGPPLQGWASYGRRLERGCRGFVFVPRMARLAGQRDPT